jgi:hypothetical protein
VYFDPETFGTIATAGMETTRETEGVVSPAFYRQWMGLFADPCDEQDTAQTVRRQTTAITIRREMVTTDGNGSVISNGVV